MFLYFSSAIPLLNYFIPLLDPKEIILNVEKTIYKLFVAALLINGEQLETT